MSETTNKEVTMDTVLGTGVGADRTVPTPTDTTPPAGTQTPEEIAAAEAKALEDAKKAGTPPATPPTTEDQTLDTPENKTRMQTLLSKFSGDITDEDDKALKADYLSKHKGSNFDDKGNIINDKGEIVKSFDDIYKDFVEEDDTTLDAEGNQIDGEGKIIKTKADILAEKSVVNKLHLDSEYEFLDDDGVAKVYSDDDAGFKELADDMATQRLEEFKATFFSQTPELTDIAKHILSGGTIDDYKNPVDYSKTDVKTMTPEEKESVIRKSFEVTGMEKTRIDGFIQMFKDGNVIDKEVKSALASLETYEAEQTRLKDERYTKSVRDRQKANDDHWDSVKEKVTTGKLDFITVPDTEKDAFFNYLAKAIDSDGNSQNMVDTSTQTMEQDMAIDYLRFKKFDFKTLIGSKVGTARVDSLRERLKRSAKLEAATVVPAAQQQTQGEDITISKLLS